MLGSIGGIWRGERELSEIFRRCFVLPAVVIDLIQIPLVDYYLNASLGFNLEPVFSDPLVDLLVTPMFLSTLPLQAPWLVFVTVSILRSTNTLGRSRMMAIFWVGIQVAITLLIPAFVAFSALATIG